MIIKKGWGADDDDDDDHGLGLVAQEVRAVVWQQDGCWFDPRLAKCQGVPEQDAILTLTAPDVLVITLHG